MVTTRLGDRARLRHINDVVGSYGFELIGRGKVVQTFCPSPHSNGKDSNPSLTLYDDSQRFYCFGCRWWGDALDFIREMEHCSLQEAASKLQSLDAKPMRARPARKQKRYRNPRREGVILATALKFYGDRLFKQGQGEDGRSYLVGRNVDKDTARRLQLGYGCGGLAELLTQMGFDEKRQTRSGLFTKYPRERFNRMIVVPELRDGRVMWLTGRAVDGDARTRFQALPGVKPVLGLGTAETGKDLVITEGVFDYITLRRWGYNAVALAGNGNTDRIVAELQKVKPKRALFALDSDDKTAQMREEVAGRLNCPVGIALLPGDIEDVAELGIQTDGRERFEIAVLHAHAQAARITA